MDVNAYLQQFAEVSVNRAAAIEELRNKKAELLEQYTKSAQELDAALKTLGYKRPGRPKK